MIYELEKKKEVNGIVLYENKFHYFLKKDNTRVFLYKKGVTKSKINIISSDEKQLLDLLPVSERKRIEDECILSDGVEPVERFFYNNFRTVVLFAGDTVIVTKGWNYLLIYPGARVPLDKFNKLYHVLDSENEIIDKYMDEHNIVFDLV